MHGSRHATRPRPVRATARALLALAVATAVMAVSGSAAQAASPSARVVSSLVTVQPLDPVAGATSASLTTLRGEAESFQVVVGGPGLPAQAGVDVALATPLTAPGGATLPASATTISLEAYTRVWTPSDQEGLDPDPSLPARQRGWCRFFQANPLTDASTCGIPIDTRDGDQTPYNTTWRCGGATAPVVDVRRCLFPDALIPRVDPYYGQARNAFPFGVPAGENRVVWVDVLAPPTATAATYTGALRVSATGMDPTTVPVSVKVLPTRLPAIGEDPALTLEGGVRAGPDDGTTFCQDQGCVGASTDVSYRHQSVFVRSSLENRLPLTNLPGRDTPYPGQRPAFDKWIAPYLTGTGATTTVDGVLPARLPEARNRTVLLDHWADQTDWQMWTDALKDAGVASSLSLYCDEVLQSASLFADQCANPYDDAATPGWTAGGGTGPVRSFLIGSLGQYTTAHARGRTVTANVQTLVPNTAFHIHPRGGANTRPSYDTGFLGGGTGRRVWGFDSNNALGANAAWTIADTYNGFPVLGGVDQPATSERAVGFNAWSYRLPGHFYYSSMHQFADAWNDCSTTPGDCLYDSFGGHGDGTLYYPGPVSRVGGTQPIPIESMRLKRYRDGSEDYTVLRLLETGCAGYGGCTTRTRAELLPIVGGPEVAEGVGAMGRSWRTSIGAPAYDATRAQLVALLPQPGPPPVATDTTGRIVFASDRDGDFDIYAMDADGTDVTQLTNSPGVDRHPAWSPDGVSIAWTRGDDVWVADGDGSNPVNLTADVDGVASKPAWWLDGLLLFYSHAVPGQSSVIRSMAPDGSGKLPAVAGLGGAPVDDVTVAADGRLTFSQGGGTPGLFTSSVTGSDRTRLTADVDEVADVTGPTGDRMTFSRSTGGSADYEVWLADGDGTDAAPLITLDAGQHAFQSTWSPTATSIAYVASTGGDLEIWTAPVADGSQRTALTTNTASDVDPDWVRAGPAPFASWSAFIDRQFTDLLGRPPTPSERSTWTTRLRQHPTMRGRLVESLRATAHHTTYVDPPARLYQAFFLRHADASGLRYWASQRAAGRSLFWIATFFAGSREFRDQYGSLTDQQFVELIYGNVLGRPADPSGMAFWVAELGSGRRTRGAVMVGFSESGEFKAKTALAVDVVVPSLYLLGSLVFTGWSTHWEAQAVIGRGTDVAIAEWILGSEEYAAIA